MPDSGDAATPVSTMYAGLSRLSKYSLTIDDWLSTAIVCPLR
jgi:hypothetical protein